MMLTTVEVDDLTGAALDWAVAKAEGRDTRPGRWRGKFSSNCGVWQPSTNWAQAGPILQRERIATFPAGDGWSASYQITSNTLMRANGPTPLVAGLRCYVAGHHGQTVDVPAELLES